MRSLWKKVRRLEKGTLPPVVAVVTSMRDGKGLREESEFTHVPFLIHLDQDSSGEVMWPVTVGTEEENNLTRNI